LAPSKAIRENLLRLEQQLLSSEVRKSPVEINRLLSDDFREIGRSGNLYSKQQIISLLADEPITERSIADFETTQLAPDIVLATYKLASRNPKEGRPVYSLHCSIWRRDQSGWRMVFHQGTLER
jgi:hypothetical protein